MLALVACAGQTPEQPRVLSVDTLTSGRIVVHNAPVWNQPGAAWRVEEIVRIGPENDDGPAAFGRICDVVVGPDDFSIYVLDCHAQDVRVFDMRGQHTRTLGGRGSGPGEFQSPFALAFDAAGRLWVADEGARRYVVYGRDGQLLASVRRPIRWPAEAGNLHFSRDGTLYEYGWWSDGPGGVIRVVVDSEAAVRDSVPLPPWEFQSFAHRDRPAIRSRVPFSPRPVVAIGPEGEIWVGLGNTYSIARLDGTGDTTRVVQLRVRAADLSQAEHRAALDTIASARAQGFQTDMHRVPTSHAHFNGMAISAAGELWVRRPESRPAERRTTYVWDVFEPDGRYLNSVLLGVQESPSPQIGRNYLAGVARDELDREYILVYRIHRNDVVP